LPPVSTTLAKLVAKFSAGVVDTGGKFATGVVDTCGNFAAGVNNTGGNFMKKNQKQKSRNTVPLKDIIKK
jgi:hypothetical protein